MNLAIHFSGKRLVFFIVILTVFVLFHLCFYYLLTSVSDLIFGDDDTLGQQDLDLLVRQEEYLMTRSLEEEELRQLGRLDLLRMEMEEIGNMEMAAEYGDKSYWFKRKMGKMYFKLDDNKYENCILEALDEFLKSSDDRMDE